MDGRRHVGTHSRTRRELINLMAAKSGSSGLRMGCRIGASDEARRHCRRDSGKLSDVKRRLRLGDRRCTLHSPIDSRWTPGGFQLN